MRKHLYFHSSDFKYINLLKEDPCFQDVSEYHPIEQKDIVPNEWGRVLTDVNYYHFLLGTVLLGACPWCGSEPFLKKLNNSIGLEYSSYCMQCTKCGSRGPILNTSLQIEIRKSDWDYFYKFIKDRYADRLSWDDESFGVLPKEI